MLSGKVEGAGRYEHPSSAPRQAGARKFHLSLAPAPLKTVHWTSSRQRRGKWQQLASWGAGYVWCRSFAERDGAGGGGGAGAVVVVAVVA